jgi:hypothetical protein
MTANHNDACYKIEAQKGEVARLRRELEIAEAVLRGMQSMLPADLSTPRPPRVSDDAWIDGMRKLATNINSERLQQTKGRQPGAISHQWRDTLRMLFMNYPDGFTEYNATIAAHENNLPNVKPRDALDRLMSYMTHNYVERVADGRWRVTDYAVQKYGFSSPKMNEAPEAETREAP